ncbi:MAG: ABC transporter substrate-binding protein, partial [Rhodomicrobiaceae bacterium]
MNMLRKLAAAATALLALGSAAMAQSKVTLAIGGASCLCYLPTVLAQQ